MSVWINEFHYDNFGTDAGEFIEVAASAGTDLTGWTIVRYNGSGGAPYTSPGAIPVFSGIVADQTGTGFGFLTVTLPQDGLQNGAPDGFALVDNLGHVVQFLSYEGSFVAVGGPANGMTSSDVGVIENGAPVGTSLGLQGSGSNFSDFTWAASATTSGATNTGQTLGGGPVAPSVSVSDVTITEGDAGSTAATFTITRTGGSGAFTVNYATADETANAGSDYVAASGTVSFAAGVNVQTVTVDVTGETSVEGNETFFLNLTGATGGAAISDAQGQATITNDDVAPPVTGAVWINEFHYDNSGADVGEFIEVAGPAGLDLSGYSLVLYNGNGGVTYGTLALGGVFANQQNGFGVLSFAAPGLQNGGSGATPDTDGIALIGPGGVIEFISYEGHFAATNGPAAGLTSVNVGVAEDGTASGTAVARTGPGAEGTDFTWTLTGDTHGAVNTGQTFLAPSPRIHVSDPTVTEGDSGTQLLTFTITRTGTAEAFQVHYATADGTAASGSDYVAVSGDLSFGVGETSRTVEITVNGDANVEGNETVLLNLTGPTNGAVIIDSQGRGVIANDDVALVKIYEIQGASHTSPLVGQHVFTEGVVTAIDTSGSIGFWIQDETGDGNAATSDAVFVFTNADPTATVHVGDRVRVEGTVNEFQGSDTNNLTITEVGTSLAGVSVVGAGTIAPTLIGGVGGLHPPTAVIEDDGFATFDPAQDGADFFESIEGMLVTVKNAQVVDATFGNSTWIVADNGADASGMNSRGGISISAGDLNPEKVQIFADSGVTALHPAYVAGDHPGDVTGVISYFGGQYELLPTSIQSLATAGSAPRETTTLADGDADHVTIGAYNVENLDPTDPQSKFDQLGADIANNLGSPDIVGLEEIQDADGAGNGADFSGAATLGKLIDAIVAAGGPHYQFIEIAPTANNANGGEPNGNIRQAFLYNPDRVQYVAGSAHQLFDNDPLNGDAFNNSRHPLVADFVFHGETITTIDVHNVSRLGSDEPFGQNQPPINGGEQRRIDQTTPIKQYVEGLVAADPHAHVAVMGDFNGFQFELAQTQLESGGALSNLTNLLPVNEQFSFGFEGNMQQIDHLFVSPGLQAGAEFDIVHLNSGQPVRPTDHDPIVSRLFVNTAPVAVADTAYAATEDTALTVNALNGLLANDTDLNGDALTAALQAGPARGSLTLNADGSFSYTPLANYNGPDSFSYLVHDPSGASSNVATVSFQVAAVNDTPVAVADAAPVAEDQTVVIDVLGNDTDVDLGDTKTLVSVSATAKGASVSIVDGKVVYQADADSFDLLALGQTTTDTFTYQMKDATGATSLAAVTVTISGVGDAPSQTGGNGADSLTGTAGDERLDGGNGADRLLGGEGADTLIGGGGDDVLLGGAGIDSLSGGSGADLLDGGAGSDWLVGGKDGDRFVFSGTFGKDVVADFESGDRLMLDHGQFADTSAVMSHAAQVGADVVITLDAANSITLLGLQLSSLKANDFLFA